MFVLKDNLVDISDIYFEQENEQLELLDPEMDQTPMDKFKVVHGG